ncbi:hypothetical protein BH09BAC3_BH09BAC3_16150 [soil metagenome]
MKEIKRLVAGIGFIFLSLAAFGQKETKPTLSFEISGEVKAPVTIQIADLSKWKAVVIGDVVITNHLGEMKSKAKGLKGVLLKELLSSVEINSESPRVLSEYYFVCKANDGYTVVYSWNEIFNSIVGNTVYIITEKDGNTAASMDDSILMISSRDFRTGRRHIKALASIEVKRAK